MTLSVLWHTLQAYRRSIFRGGSRGTHDWRQGLERFFADPGDVIFWLHHYKGPALLRELALREGGVFRLRAGTPDRLAIREVLVRDIYRLAPFAPGSLECVLDVGAHVGTFSRVAAPKAKRLFAFEPVAENFALLRQNLDAARFPHVELVNKAVAAKAGTLRFAVSETATTGHSAFGAQKGAGHGGPQRAVEIEAVGLTGFLAERKIERLDLLKLDCEGAEYEIVAALVGDPAVERIRRIYLEYHAGLTGGADWNGPALAEKLRGAGFAVEVAPGEPGADWGQIYASR